MERRLENIAVKHITTIPFSVLQQKDRLFAEMVPPEVFVTTHLTMIEYKKDLQPNYCCLRIPECSFLDVCRYASAERRADDLL